MRTRKVLDRGYSMEARDRYFEATCSMVEYEIRPGNPMTFLAEVDLSEVEEIRDKSLAAGGRKPSYTTFVVKATAMALKRFPYANRRVVPKWFLGRYRQGRLQKFHHADIGVACERWMSESSSCVFADVIRDADQRNLSEINAWLYRLARSTMANNQQWRSFRTLIDRFPAWLSALLIRLPVFLPKFCIKYRGAAVLVSSPAKYGVDGLAGSWTSPLGVSFGLVKPRPVVCDGVVVARPTFMLSMNFDRRVMAGAQAAKVLRRIVEILEDASNELHDPQAPRLADPNQSPALGPMESSQPARRSP